MKLITYKRKLLFLLLTVISTFINSQIPKPPILEGTCNGVSAIISFKKTINGLNLGLFNLQEGQKLNGIHLELIGMGFPLAAAISIDRSYFGTQKAKQDSIVGISGICISGFGPTSPKIQGLSLTPGISVTKYFSGVSISLLSNLCYSHSGLQIAFYNRAYTLKGVQIGLFNKNFSEKGLQLGLWNTNTKRSFPIINW